MLLALLELLELLVLRPFRPFLALLDLLDHLLIEQPVIIVLTEYLKNGKLLTVSD